LNGEALAALTDQKAHTLLAGGPNGVVFTNPFTREAFKDDWRPGECWRIVLQGEGLRHRNAYQTRHTFASLALMAGANPFWVARQLGHVAASTMFRHYARWIEGADQGRESAKLDAAFAEPATGERAAQ
jgi:integrase